MSAKDKESKTFEKFKQFFRAVKTNQVNYKVNYKVFVLSQDLVKEIGPTSPIHQRIKALKELSEVVITNRLEDYGVEKLWNLTRDLFCKEVDTEHRHIALHFLKCLTQGQYEKLGVMRVYFFNLIKTHDIPEDTTSLLELLQVLTQNGRDIHQLEDQFGRFLASWLPDVAGTGKVADVLELLVNFIKCNSAYIDEEDVMKIVDLTGYICCQSPDRMAVQNGLKVLGAVVCYSELPREALPNILSALCRKVNDRDFTLTCWKITRDLLGTHMGHTALFTICRFLQNPAMYNDKILLRGAVFFLNMGLWSDKRVSTLRCTPTSVLPSILQVLESRHSVVFFEVMLSVEQLVEKFSKELQFPAWDVLLDILHQIVRHVEAEVGASTLDDFVPRMAIKLHDTLTSVEELIEVGQFNGNVQRVFDLVEISSRVRPESSVLRLITYHATSIKPNNDEWLTKLDALVDKYFKLETRPNIRIKVVDVVSSVLSKYRCELEEELVERIILTYFVHAEQADELCVRKAVAQLLISLCLETESKKCLDVLNILEKLLNRPYDLNLTALANEGDILDVKTVAEGLISIFHSKLHWSQSGYSTRVYKILVGHLELHYLHQGIMDFQHDVNLKVFEMLMKLRVNMLGQVGLVESSGPKFTPYLIVESTALPFSGTGSAPPSPAPSTPFSLASASKVIISALCNEKDWRIIHFLLTELPIVMQNRALVFHQYGADINLLADVLCSLVREKTMLESLKFTPPKLNRGEFQSMVYPAVAAISAYHNCLEPTVQVRCISSLESGVASRCASQCVLALTTCALEMMDTMYKLLPQVLLKLTKMSSTVHVAIPVLEFLSTLTSLPKVFASFVGDQYMAVFAIALPYTNPFKFNHYIVSLAHHVIAVWFLKCRLPFRRDSVKFITVGLKANAVAPFEDQMLAVDQAPLNEDSTSRKRSSSLTEQGSRRRERPVAKGPPMGSYLRPPLDDSLMNFHVELMETCIDLMARYTFSSCEAKPSRSATAEFLLNGGQAQTWLLGHKLITVTTSGCSQKPLKNNLCDRCWIVCRLNRDCLSPEVDSEKDDRRRDKFAIESQDTGVGDEAKRGSDPKLEKLTFGNSTEDTKFNRDVCACWCQGWAEIYVRRPTGDMSWVMRLQNETHYANSADMPFTDLSSLFLTAQPPQKSTAPTSAASSEDIPEEPSSSHSLSSGILTVSTSSFLPPASHPVSIPGSPTSRNSSKDSVDEELEHPSDLDPLSANKARNPVRRSNSSPEMSSNWKNPFLKDKSDENPKARVSCEAIPEEMTPPEAAVSWKPPPSGGRRRDLRLDVDLNEDMIGRLVREPLSPMELDGPSALPPTFTRDRSRTISVMSPARKTTYGMDNTKTKAPVSRNKDAPRSGICPSFVFLQLYHSSHFGGSEEKPILISNNPVIQRAISALDFIPPFETHKVGVIYVGPGQAGNEAEILHNECGSVRYAMFLQSLGTLITLKDADPQATFLGGLDKNGVDGKVACIWQDDVTQVTFHVATLMPNKDSDPSGNMKKLHIGNDYVTIVYNESGEECNYLKGQFNYASVVIEPLDLGSNKVTVKARDELAELIGHGEMKIVSDENLAILARQLALHANLASEVSRSLKTKNRTEPYASNWLERLRKIKRLRKKALEMDAEEPGPPETTRGKKPEHFDDFTEYT